MDQDLNRGERTFRIVVLAVAAVGVLVIAALGWYLASSFMGSDLEGTPTSTAIGLLATEMTQRPSAGDTTVPEIATVATDQDGEEPNQRATATAACELYQSQFPGTPCPDHPVPGIEQTATAACDAFQDEFPGTPCP